MDWKEMIMGKKKKKGSTDLNDPASRACPTCTEWGAEDPQEFPCGLAKVVVVRAHPRVNCAVWRGVK